ncbi:LysR family transcriptional regulator [Yoonia sp. 2307UL14-13]|uniref:LysR family transcriptional regulator n=1 Tax=Yoonia sp. 2307UL14-13 TaxID=3126506 RepID=UPI0030A428F0
MDWRDLPSLAALRAFEAAARCGSFSQAARELNVTHAAIAQHVRAIEAQLTTSLMIREGRGVTLTATGRQLATALSDGFGQIASGVRAVASEAAERPIAITTTPTFAENWLMPRLAGFWTAHPGVAVSINPDTGVTDLRRDGFDLGIRYGMGDWPGVAATALVASDYTIVGAPSLLKGRKADNLADVADLPWIFETVHKEARRWVTSMGLDLACCQMNEVATFGLLLPAVRAGAGLSVVSSAIVADDIAAGRLVAVMTERRQGQGYHIIHPPGPLSERVKLFKTWLLAQGDVD